MITNACRSLFRRTARPRTLRRRDGRRAGVGRLGVSALVVVVAQLAVAAALAAPPVHTFDLGAGYAAQVRADGGLWVGSGATPLLEAIPRDITTGLRQRHRAAVPFTAVTAEGAPGGQRGFSVRRDDDQDGRVDEDRLDGRDNDGDGLIDEDFAAMGDAMAVVSPDPAVHFTYVHWNAAHLGSLLFLMAEAPTGAYGIDLGRGAWSEQTLVAERHDLTGRPETARATAFVGRPDAADAPWIGVIVLDPGPVPRVVLEDARLDIRLQDKALPVAIAIAPTRMQLSRMLNEAVRVRRGVVDRVTGERAAWIAPPLCARCRLAESAAATWRRDDHGRLHLTMSVAADRSGAVDPDLFRIGGRPLGPVSEIRWEPSDGPGRTLVWDATARAATPAGPWRELAAATAHGAVGRLEFVFPRDESLSRLVLDGRLEGVYRDGRPFRAELAAAPVMAGLGGEASVSAEAVAPAAATAAAPVDPARTLREASRPPTLSPSLLDGFPNPFRDVIQLRFQVPATMGEAFVWDDDETPTQLDVSAAVPWRSGTPRVTVKIYSVNGQELVTLFSGDMGVGENVVSWSGTDSYGRSVSSGTYFCKLQMDDWSVTRRLVYIR